MECSLLSYHKKRHRDLGWLSLLVFVSQAQCIVVNFSVTLETCFWFIKSQDNLHIWSIYYYPSNVCIILRTDERQQ